MSGGIKNISVHSGVLYLLRMSLELEWASRLLVTIESWRTEAA
jgi:hypothetical protein